jgi:hypothetical protein
MTEELTGPTPSEFSRSSVAELTKLVNEGWDYFWSRDETRGYGKDGKRIGTGIPRERNENSTFGGRTIPFGKSKKPSKRKPRRSRRV